MTSYSNVPQLPDMDVGLEDFINGDEVVEITDKHEFVKKKAIE